MTADEHDSPPYALLRLRVIADADPSVLSRVLGHFQNLNLTPRSVRAEFGATALLHLAVDVCGMPRERLTVIAAKIGQMPCVLNAYWHEL